MINYYKILGVKDFASLEEIRSAYRKLSKKLHPDVNDGDKFFEGKFKEIQEAYEILANSNKKTKYDQDLRNQIINRYSSNENRETWPNNYYHRQKNAPDKKRHRITQNLLSKRAKLIICLASLVIAAILFLLDAEEIAAEKSLANKIQQFSIGASQADVFRIQGWPTNSSYINDSLQIWYYDSSTVIFKNKLVIEYYNRDSNLKIILK